MTADYDGTEPQASPESPLDSEQGNLSSEIDTSESNYKEPALGQPVDDRVASQKSKQEPSKADGLKNDIKGVESVSAAAAEGGANVAADIKAGLWAGKKVAKKAKFVFGGCAAIVLWVVILIGAQLSVPNPSFGLVTTSESSDSTAGATVPNTVTELKVGSKTIKMPTTKGKTGREQYLPGMTFSGQCNATEKKWYITMRWPYVKWKFNGGSTYVDAKTTNTKFSYATVRVIAYNPKTKKAVVTAICESGPAPWTGSSWYDKLPAADKTTVHRAFVAATKRPPSNWTKALQFDPPGADGRVSGLAPDAMKAIGAETNDTLEYGFAEDQSVALGPVK